nr:hypothetical protein [Tanacetum cinerariifolium]
MTESPLVDSGLMVPVFSPGDDLIACLNKAMAFLTAVASLRFPSTNNQLRTSSNPRNQATIQDGRVIVQQVQGRKGQNYSGTVIRVMLLILRETIQVDRKGLLNITTVKTEDLDTYDFDCDDLSNAQTVLMANISNYGIDVISEVPHSETYLNDMENQSVLAMLDFEQPPAMDPTDNEIHSDSNIISYSQYLLETQQANVQDTHLQAQQAEQAFWLRMSDPTSKPSDALPVKTEAPKELPKISLVNESLKKLKFHLVKFDSVVKIRTTPNALTEVFDQMGVALQQSSVDKQCLEITKKELILENDRLLQQIMSQDVLLTVMNSMSLIGDTQNKDGNRKESCNLEAELLKSQNAFNDLLKSHSQLKKHCISLECSIQLNQEIFQKHESCDNQNALEIPEYFQNNDLKAQLQDKDITICKLKDIIKSLREKSKEENVNYDYGKIKTKFVELENSVAKLNSENKRRCNEINHVKQVFKKQFESIKIHVFVLKYRVTL